jgi:hypothetical protein
MNNTEIVLNEIKNSKYSNLIPNNDTTGIYMCRIFYNNHYFYKIGKTTTNLSYCLRSFNERIILIFYGKTNNVNAEKYIHNKLKKYQYTDKKLYHISSKLYDIFKKELKYYSKNYFFESIKYVIDDNNNEYYHIDNEYIDFYSGLDNNDYIELDRDILEERYWIENKKAIRDEYKLDDSDYESSDTDSDSELFDSESDYQLSFESSDDESSDQEDIIVNQEDIIVKQTNEFVNEKSCNDNLCFDFISITFTIIFIINIGILYISSTNDYTIAYLIASSNVSIA